MANTVVYNHYDYTQALRARLNKPTCWEDVLLVKYSDSYAIVGGYISSGLTSTQVVAGTRGTAYTYGDFVITADTLTINTYKNIPVFIDEADRYQQSYVGWMTLADMQGKAISERLETAMLAAHASWTNFGASDLTGTDDDTTAITVSTSNIDNIIRSIKRKVNAHNGVERALQFGYFIVWRALDFEMLEAFVQANGFNTADLALKNGIPVEKAFRYMGVDHYLSNSHATGHLFAGVKKQGEIGILRGTYGKVKQIEDPGNVSGLGLVSRVDYGLNWPAQNAEFLIDVNVA